MTANTEPKPHVANGRAEPLWFLGTLARIKLSGEQTGGRFALFEGELPHGAAPPLHSHPQDETFYVLDGELTVWVDEEPRLCPRGSVAFAPAGVPHTFRVESDTARMLVLSTPAGFEKYVQALAEPARWPWLQPPPDGPRVSAGRLEAVERSLGFVRHGPPPPPRPANTASAANSK